MDYRILAKDITEYLLRVFGFIIVTRCCFFHLAGIFGLVVLPIIIVHTLCNKLTNIGNFNDSILNYNITFDVCIVALSTLYILAKIFGIFKKLDKCNIFVSFIIISIISYLLVLLGKTNIFIDKNFYELWFDYAWTMYLLVPAFLLYKFFGLLAKKFPFPFGKIGYYTSIEFPRDLYLKIRKNIKYNSQK